jgi:hypothetical protein
LAPFLFIEIGISIEPWELLFCYNFQFETGIMKKTFLKKGSKYLGEKVDFFLKGKKKVG